MAEMKLVLGDILEPNEDDKDVIVCHQVNCQGAMGAGLGKQVRQMHPSVYASYKEKCAQIKAGFGGLGDVQFCSALDEAGYIVANVFGQDRYGRWVDKHGNRVRYTDYAALRKAFTHIAQRFPTHTVRIPHFMGCGLGGGDWKTVKKIIEETLVANGVSVEIWQFPF